MIVWQPATPSGLTPSMQGLNDAPLGKADFFTDLRDLIPTRKAQCWCYELCTNVALTKRMFVHHRAFPTKIQNSNSKRKSDTSLDLSRQLMCEARLCNGGPDAVLVQLAVSPLRQA